MLKHLRMAFVGLILTTSTANAQTTYEYGRGATQNGSKSLLLDYFPAASGCSSARPTVVFVHGGGFSGGTRRGAVRKGYPQAFNAAGINFASIDYRLIGDQPVPSAPYAAMLKGGQNPERKSGQANAAVAAFEDTNTALKFLVANAGRTCINTDEIYLMGSSAGAVTVLNVAYSFDEAGISRPSIEGVIDLWGGSLPPTSIDRGNIPVFVAHGEKDPTVDFAWAESIWIRANAVGVPVQLHAFANKRHGFDLNRTRVNGTPVMDLAVRFVQNIVAGRPIKTLRTRSN